MSEPVKFLFDANFGRPLVEALANLVRFAPDAPVVQHLFAFSPPLLHYSAKRQPQFAEIVPKPPRP